MNLRVWNNILRDKLKCYLDINEHSYGESTGYPFRKRLATSLQEYLISRSNRAFSYNGFDWFRNIRGHLLDEKYQAIEFILDKMKFRPSYYGGEYGISSAGQLQTIIEESSYKDVLLSGDLGKILSVHMPYGLVSVKVEKQGTNHTSFFNGENTNSQPGYLRKWNQHLRSGLESYLDINEHSYDESTGYPFRKRLATSLQEYLISRSNRAFSYNGFDWFRNIRGHLLDEKYQAIEFILDKMKFRPSYYGGEYGISSAGQLQTIIEESSYKDVLLSGDLGKILYLHIQNCHAMSTGSNFQL